MPQVKAVEAADRSHLLFRSWALAACSCSLRRSFLFEDARHISGLSDLVELLTLSQSPKPVEMSRLLDFCVFSRGLGRAEAMSQHLLQGAFSPSKASKSPRPSRTPSPRAHMLQGPSSAAVRTGREGSCMDAADLFRANGMAFIAVLTLLLAMISLYSFISQRFSPVSHGWIRPAYGLCPLQAHRPTRAYLQISTFCLAHRLQLGLRDLVLETHLDPWSVGLRPI